MSEVSIKEAYEHCFETHATEHLSTTNVRRMSKVLTLANWRKDGKFHTGTRRNQVKFINLNELSDTPDDPDWGF